MMMSNLIRALGSSWNCIFLSPNRVDSYTTSHCRDVSTSYAGAKYEAAATTDEGF